MSVNRIRRKTLQDQEEESIFERYYKLIEIARLKAMLKTPSLELLYLERVIELIDRALQDFNNDEANDEALIRHINLRVECLLINWFVFLEKEVDTVMKVGKVPVIITQFAYYISPLVPILKNYKGLLERLPYYIQSLNPPKYARTVKVVDAKIESTKINFLSIYYGSLNDVLELLNYVIDKKIFGVPKLNSILQEDINKFDNDLFNAQVVTSLEVLIIGDDEYFTYLWHLDISFNNIEKKYKASEIGYFIWALSSALEAVPGIEVNIETWWDGSKHLRLTIKIPDNVAKYDVTSILRTYLELLNDQINLLLEKQVAQSVAESDVEQVGSEKSENSGTPTISSKEDPILINDAIEINVVRESNPEYNTQGLMSDVEQLLKLQTQMYELQERSLALEERKAKLKQSNLGYNMNASSVILEATIKNNSDIVMMLNDILMASVEAKHYVKRGDLDMGTTEEIKIRKK